MLRFTTTLLFTFFTILITAVHGQGRFQDQRKSLSQIIEQNPPLAASYLYAQGVQAQLTGRQNDAITQYEAVLKINPSHGPSYYNLSRIAASNNDPSRALDLIHRAIELDSTNSEYLRHLSSIYVSVRNYDQALDVAEQLIERDQEPENYLMAAALAHQIGKIERAEQLCRRYNANWGYDPRVTAILNRCLLMQNRLAEADKLMQDALMHDSADPSNHRLYAQIKAALYQDSAAMMHYNRAIELDSLGYENHLALAEYHRVKGHPSTYLEALVPLFSATDLDPRDKASFFEDVYFNPLYYKDFYSLIDRAAMGLLLSDPTDSEVVRVYGRFLMYVGRLDEAGAIHRSQISAGRAVQNDYRSIIDLEMYQKNQDSVAYYCRLAMDEYPTESHYPLVLSVSLWQSEHRAEALTSLKKTLKLAESDSIRSVIYGIRGDIQHEMGREKECYREYAKAMKYDPGNASVLNNWAYYLSLRDQDLEFAANMAQRATEIESSNATYLDTYAWVLHRQGKNKEAQIIMRQCLGLDRENNPELLLHYGDILYALEEDFLARTYWKRALDAGADPAKIAEREKQPKLN